MKELVKTAKTATVVMDACEMGADRCTAAAVEFFESRGIDVKVYALNFGEDMLYLSSLSKAEITSKTGELMGREEDIYLNLCSCHRKACAAAEAKNRRSKAVFRAGRIQSKARPYDLYVSGTEYAIMKDVFKTMAGIIEVVSQ